MLRERFSKMSVRWKTVLVTVVTTTVVLAVAASVLMVSHWAYHVSESRRRLSMLAEISSLNVASALLFDDEEAARETLASLRAVPDVVCAGILDQEGNLFASFRRDEESSDCPAERGAVEAGVQEGIVRGGGALTAFTPVRQDGEVLGTLYVHHDLSRLYAWVRSFAVTTALVFVGALAIAVALSWQMQRFVTRSLLRLHGVIRRISVRRDFSLRAQRTSGDEVGEVVDGFNRMLELIQQRDAALQRHRDTLEEEVRQRTEALDRKNRALLQETEDRRLVAEALARRVEVEQLVATISTRFLNLPADKLHQAIEESLGKVAELTEADLAFVAVFSEDGESIETFHRWVGAGYEQTTVFEGLLLSPLSWSTQRLRDGQQVAFARLAELPDEAVGERELCEARGLRSLLLLPLAYSGRLVAAAGLGRFVREGPWVEEEGDLVRLVGEIVLGALQRQRGQEEREQLDERIRQSQKLESLGVLTGGIAHDFNNLLMSILGNAELAADEEITPLAAESLRAIQLAGKQASDLCRQMLAYSGQGRIDIQAVDLNQVLRELSELVRTSMSKKASLKLEFDQGLRMIRADLSQIRQVAMNLIINAAEAIGDQAGTVTVRTAMRHCTTDFFRHTYLGDELPDGDYVLFEVEDTGCGMDETTLRRVFDPFFTTKFTGRGLGLAAVLGIVRSHRAALDVQSQPGEGTRFTVYLPEAHDLDQIPEPSAETGVDPLPWLDGGTVLLADDQKIVRDTVAQMLRKLGMHVVVAEDGAQAVAMARECADSLRFLVLDVNMPQMTGAEALRDIRSFARDVPAILSSGYGEEEAIPDFAPLRPAAFIEKPYSIDALVDIIRKMIRRDAEFPNAAPPNER